MHHLNRHAHDVGGSRGSACLHLLGEEATMLSAVETRSQQ